MVLVLPINMLSVKPGRVIAGIGEGEALAVCARLSVVLLTSATLLPNGLKIMVNSRLGESAISPGCALTPSKEMRVGESWSSVAFTMFTTGVPPAPLGKRGFETKTRNASLLGPLLVPGELEPPQEIMGPTATTSAKIPINVLFKP